MAPTGYRLYLHSARLPEFLFKRLPLWNKLKESKREKFLKQASQLKELQKIICDNLHIEPDRDEDETPKKRVQSRGRSPMKRERSRSPDEDDEDWRPSSSLSLLPASPMENDSADEINFLRLRSRSLQRPKRPLRLRPEEPSISENSPSRVCYKAKNIFEIPAPILFSNCLKL